MAPHGVTGSALWRLMMVAVGLASVAAQAPLECAPFEYERCAQIGEPLVREPHLAVPDNVADIELVCRTWTHFVDCLKRYTERCFSDQQRRQFNKAVEHPIASVHQMCMQPLYQKEYLQYAGCIKRTIVNRHRCGPHYGRLVDQVAQGEVISKATLCCSHDHFKQCVHAETRHLCDDGAPQGPASRFAAQILDKALSFLQEQCANYIATAADCAPTPTPIASSSSSEMSMFADEIARAAVPSTAASDIYPWSTASVDGVLGSRTRPASYGRSSSWSEQQLAPSVAGSTTQAWHPSRYAPEPTTARSVVEAQETYETHQHAATATETWYPAAGNQLSNEVDEPNQQGLKYSTHAAAARVSASMALLAVIFSCFL